MDSKPSIESSEKETPKRLAFSVENILDPNKFTGKKHYGQGANGIRMWNNIERDERMDDDQSDDHSSEYFLFLFAAIINRKIIATIKTATEICLKKNLCSSIFLSLPK